MHHSMMHIHATRNMISISGSVPTQRFISEPNSAGVNDANQSINQLIPLHLAWVGLMVAV